MVNLCYLFEGACFEDPMICDSSGLCRCLFLCLNGKSSTACLNFLAYRFALSGQSAGTETRVATSLETSVKLGC